MELARVTCEKERRHREKEARLEKQRLMEADRNKAALDRFFFLEQFTIILGFFWTKFHQISFFGTKFHQIRFF